MTSLRCYLWGYYCLGPYGPDGAPLAVIDWKSDVDPWVATVQHSATQIRRYMQAAGAEQGLIVS